MTFKSPTKGCVAVKTISTCSTLVRDVQSQIDSVNVIGWLSAIATPTGIVPEASITAP